jgi:hypothetical protein
MQEVIKKIEAFKSKKDFRPQTNTTMKNLFVKMDDLDEIQKEEPKKEANILESNLDYLEDRAQLEKSKESVVEQFSYLKSFMNRFEDSESSKESPPETVHKKEEPLISEKESLEIDNRVELVEKQNLKSEPQTSLQTESKEVEESPFEKGDTKSNFKVDQNDISKTELFFKQIDLGGEVLFLENLIERVDTLFDSLQSNDIKGVEDKLDLTLKYLQYISIISKERLDEIDKIGSKN